MTCQRISLFVDDSLLHMIIGTKEDHTILQEDLHICSSMQTNARYYGLNKTNPTFCNYSVHDQHLQTVKVSLDLSWNQHVDNTVNEQQTVSAQIFPGTNPRGGGGLIFFYIRRFGPSIYHSPKKISGISSNPKDI